MDGATINEKEPLLNTTNLESSPTYNHLHDTLKGSPQESINWCNKATPSEHQYIVYQRRWYLLALYASLVGSQAMIWNTWGAIADTAKAVLGWTDGDIALLTNWGPITMCVSVPFFSWLMDAKGLKVSMLSSSTLVVLGAAIRCIPVPTEYIKWTMNIGHILNGLGGPLLVAGPPLFSATWFPPHQRTTSTGILTSVGYLGVAASFLIGPMIVSEYKCTNMTRIFPSNQTVIPNCHDIDSVVKSKHLHEINTFLYIECGLVALLFLLSWLYFPAKPPTPPSASAETKREDFVPGAKILAVSKQFWLPALCYSVCVGFYNVWETQIDTIFLNTMGVNQATTGWIGFYSNLAGAAGGLIFSRIVDMIGGKMKLVLLCLSSAGVVCFTWFILLSMGAINYNLASLYVCNILFAFIINGTIPIYYEITVEGVYPVAEGITTGVLSWLNAFTGIIFLLVMMIPNISVSWTNWATIGSILFCIPVLLMYKEKYNRLLLDTADEKNE